MGGGPAVAERLATSPEAGPQQARATADAVHQAFAHGASATSLVGGVVVAAGTLIVIAVPPGRRARQRPGEKPAEAPDMAFSDSAH